jgi:hypothetical protein
MRRLVFILGLSLLCSTVSMASVLTGGVLDTSGGVLPKAVVLLLSESDRSPRYLTHTDDRGLFRFEDVQPDKYTLQIESRGFRQYKGPELEIGLSPKELPAIVVTLGLSTCQSTRIDSSDLSLLPAGSQTGALSGSFSLWTANSRRLKKMLARPAKICVRLLDNRHQLVREESASVARGFRLSDLPPGMYSLELKGAELYDETWSVEVRQGLNVEYVFPEEPSRDVRSDPSRRRRGEPPDGC